MCCRIIPLYLLLLLSAVACSSGPPRNIGNSCDIFTDKKGWYKDARRAQERWGTPIHVMLAIIYQESRFVDDAKPPRDRILWVIPWGRISSAYGYAQAQDSTWDWYKKEAGSWGADRDDFDDAVDFIGWYTNTSHRMLGISRADAYSQYLAYHEGQGGYRRKTYKQKPWLIKVANKVNVRAANYRKQLDKCEGQLDSSWSLWPF